MPRIPALRLRSTGDGKLDSLSRISEMYSVRTTWAISRASMHGDVLLWHSEYFSLETIHEAQVTIYVLDTGGQIHLTVLHVARSIVEVSVEHRFIGGPLQVQVHVGRVRGKVGASPGKLSYEAVS